MKKNLLNKSYFGNRVQLYVPLLEFLLEAFRTGQLCIVHRPHMMKKICCIRTKVVTSPYFLSEGTYLDRL